MAPAETKSQPEIIEIESSDEDAEDSKDAQDHAASTRVRIFLSSPPVIPRVQDLPTEDRVVSTSSPVFMRPPEKLRCGAPQELFGTASDPDFESPPHQSRAQAEGRPAVLPRPMIERDGRMTLVYNSRTGYTSERRHHVSVTHPPLQDHSTTSEQRHQQAATRPRLQPLDRSLFIAREYRLRTRTLLPAEWPPHIVQLAENYNPDSIVFAPLTPGKMCGCKHPCRNRTCSNAKDGIYCDSQSCTYGGACGNGIQTSKSIRLTRVEGTDFLTLQAMMKIPEGVGLVEYLGEVSLEPVDHTQRKANEGYRLHFHDDPDLWGTRTTCVNALRAGSLMRFLNHSCTPTARFREVSNGTRTTIVATTCRVVQPGEELTVDYGADIWFECQCQLCQSKAEKEKSKEC